MVVGTPQYFSPEQARGLAIDGRADVYSLGVTLFRSATGALPFDGDDWYEIARQHVEDRPPRPRSLAPGMSAELERVILRCLAKDPDRRFSSAEALREALAGLASAATDPARTRTVELSPHRSSGSRSLGSRRSRLRARRGAAIAAGGALVAVAAVASLRDDRRPRSQAAAAVPESSFASRITPPARPSDSGTAALAPGGGVQPRPDSQLAPITAAGTRSTAGLRVYAPRGAQVRIDGVAVGAAPWSSDTLPPGRHDVTAVLRSIDGCSSARQDRTVSLVAGRAEEVSLRPTPCGWLRLTIQNVPRAVYTLTSLETGRSEEAMAAGTVWLVRPEGWYSLRVAAAPPCMPFETPSLRIRAGTTTPKRVPLMCR